MKSNRPIITLFMLTSLDGKISTGNNNNMDFDKDLPNIKGVKKGLYQYYDLEKKTDLHSLNTGRVMEKIGVNNKKDPLKSPVSFIVIDNKPHLTEKGVRYMAKWGQKLYLITTNKKHPVFSLKDVSNIEIIYYPKLILKKVLEDLQKKYKIERITIQSGGTMNSAFLIEGLIDHLSIVVAPVIVGGKDTSTLIDGESLHSKKDLKNIKALKLVKCNVLKDSYTHLLYDVIN